MGAPKKGYRFLCGVVVIAVLLVTQTAFGAGNDLVLNRLGECVVQDIDGRDTCVGVIPDVEGFRAVARDLGLSLSPKGLSPAETLGIAGFEYSFEMLFNTIDSSQEAWQSVVEDRTPSDMLLVSQFHFSKGLPFSFEVGGVLSHLFDSSLWAVGAELSWALHEDTLWPVPDLGVRGFVTNVVGSPDLNLTVAGFDALLGVPVGISNVIQMTPYFGYNMTVVFSSSRLLDASPDDPTPPVEALNGGVSIKPEFVFDSDSEMFHRFIAGMRLRYAFVNFSIEAIVGGDVQTFGVKLGLDM